MSPNGEMTGGIRERYGRDKKHPSRASAPVFIGLSEDLGRDERFSSKSIKNETLLIASGASSYFNYSLLTTIII